MKNDKFYIFISYQNEAVVFTVLLTPTVNI